MAAGSSICLKLGVVRRFQAACFVLGVSRRCQSVLAVSSRRLNAPTHRVNNSHFKTPNNA
eukprot:472821-Alexandrium_andersonii.AAC.1